MTDSLIGTRLGNYVIESLVSIGSYSKNYRAHEIKTDRLVTLKVLSGYSEHNKPRLERRFEQEARIIEQFDHPNIVRVYTYGEENGVFYIAMQYIVGGTLDEHFKLRFPLEVELACLYAIQIALALHYAHQHNIVYRDLRPTSILIDDQDNNHVFLSDFGLAKDVFDPGMTKTVFASSQLSPFYMSPDSFMGGAIELKSDIYSLGCILYEMLAGRPPFLGTPLDVADQHYFTQPAYIRGFNFDVPRALALVIDTALAKKPMDRFPTALAFAKELLPFVSQQRFPPKVVPFLPKPKSDSNSGTETIPASPDEITHRIFVSYCHDDTVYCERFINDLNQSPGISIWHDDQQVGSEDLYQSIPRELENAEICIILLSPNALKSKWVLREARLAYSLQEEDESRIILMVTINGPIHQADFNGKNGWLLFRNMSRIEQKGQPLSFSETMRQVRRSLRIEQG